MKKTAAFTLTLSLFAVSCQFIAPDHFFLPPATTAPVPTEGIDRSIFKNGLASSAQPVLDEIKGASEYSIEFDIDDDLVNINGRETVRYTNMEEIALSTIRFRLFSNLFGGEMRVSGMEVDGKIIIPNYSLNDSLLIVPLTNPLEPGQAATLKMDFTLRVPETVNLNYGVQAYYNDVLALAHAYPVIAVYDDEGWNAEIPPQSGDVTYADMSFFIVRVTAPKRVVLVGTGREAAREESGDRQTVTYEAGPVRDFYLAASPDYEVYIKESNGVILRFHAREDLREGAGYALDVAARAIEFYSEQYAPYPYTELDFVATPTLALGIEYPGMIAIADRIISPYEIYLESTVAHEVGHQWFYNLVGNDQLDDPWLDESLTQFVTLQYYINEYGETGSIGFRQDILGRWGAIDNADVPIGLPVADYSGAEYSGIVYGRGALFFEALRDEMGIHAFDAFMRDYTASTAWEIATPERLKTIAEGNCKCDLTPLFEEWIY